MDIHLSETIITLKSVADRGKLLHGPRGTRQHSLIAKVVFTILR